MGDAYPVLACAFHGAVGLSSQSYGYNALVLLMVSNLNRLQNLLVELAMSDFEGAAQAAKGIAGSAKAIHDLAHLVVTNQDPKQIQAFQQLAHELEEHAGKLEAAARARNAQEVRTQISEVLEYCLACHQQFRDQAAGQQ
jgi:HPt (histidine-containing phosphotransfer) domain-containing protein